MYILLFTRSYAKSVDDLVSGILSDRCNKSFVVGKFAFSPDTHAFIRGIGPVLRREFLPRDHKQNLVCSRFLADYIPVVDVRSPRILDASRFIGGDNSHAQFRLSCEEIDLSF